MGLDFTGLNQIGTETDKPEPKTEPAGGIDGGTALQHEADARRDAIKTAADVYKLYQENIRATEFLQSEILKGIKAQENIYSLFLKAAKALSLTISNREFYSQIAKELPQYYPEAQDAATRR